MDQTVSMATELLLDILLGAFSLAVISWVLVGIQTFVNDRRREKRDEAREKRDQEKAQRDAEYHEERMKQIRK